MNAGEVSNDGDDELSYTELLDGIVDMDEEVLKSGSWRLHVQLDSLVSGMQEMQSGAPNTWQADLEATKKLWQTADNETKVILYPRGEAEYNCHLSQIAAMGRQYGFGSVKPQGFVYDQYTEVLSLPGVQQGFEGRNQDQGASLGQGAECTNPQIGFPAIDSVLTATDRHVDKLATQPEPFSSLTEGGSSQKNITATRKQTTAVTKPLLLQEMCCGSRVDGTTPSIMPHHQDILMADPASGARGSLIWDGEEIARRKEAM